MQSIQLVAPFLSSTWPTSRDWPSKTSTTRSSSVGVVPRRRRSERFAATTVSSVLLFLLVLVQLLSVHSAPSPRPRPDNGPPPAVSGAPGMPVASTFYWFNNVELALCYDLKQRVKHDLEYIYCNLQADYDAINNIYVLPQTCVSLKPRDQPLLTAMRSSCETAGGKFDFIKPSSTDAVAADQTSLAPGVSGNMA